MKNTTSSEGAQELINDTKEYLCPHCAKSWSECEDFNQEEANEDLSDCIARRTIKERGNTPVQV